MRYSERAVTNSFYQLMLTEHFVRWLMTYVNVYVNKVITYKIYAYVLTITRNPSRPRLISTDFYLAKAREMANNIRVSYGLFIIIIPHRLHCDFRNLLMLLFVLHLCLCISHKCRDYRAKQYSQFPRKLSSSISKLGARFQTRTNHNKGQCLLHLVIDRKAVVMQNDHILVRVRICYALCVLYWYGTDRFTFSICFTSTGVIFRLSGYNAAPRKNMRKINQLNIPRKAYVYLIRYTLTLWSLTYNNAVARVKDMDI